jgi:hypothetical protein
MKPQLLALYISLMVSLAGTSFLPASAQSGPGPGTFGLPVSIPIFLAGNFGEPRINHFHSGIDIKTNGATGIPVMAVADGTVSRIKVEPSGYGHALYITHNNGYTSVYGHLDSFSREIEEYVKQEQYRRESFSVDLFPEAGRFPVKKGQVVARSGNSGSSEGPHLHFEIRETASENTLNPLVGPYNLPDKIKPIINRLYVYSLQGRREWIKPLAFDLDITAGIYKISGNEPVAVDGLTGFGIETWDLTEGSTNRCGVYHIKALLDGIQFFEFTADEFAFSETRYMNSFMDYQQYVTTRRPVLKLFVDPNNHLSLYNYTKNGGRIEFSDQKTHTLSLIIEDASGNRSEASIPVRLDPSKFKRDPGFLPVYSAYFNFNEANRFSAKGIDISIPAGALYEDLYFQYESGSRLPGNYSPIHVIHRAVVPLHQYYRISIEAENLPQELKPKAIIAQYLGNGKYSAVGGTWEGERLVARSRNFGSFCIRTDNNKPVITPLNFNKPEELLKAERIRFRVTDEFPGIQSYRAEIDGKWALLEYDPKNNLMEYTFDPAKVTAGQSHTMVVKVTDMVGNTAVYTLNFNR